MSENKTKSQLVEEILQIKKIDTKQNLMKNNLKYLEDTLEKLKSQNEEVAIEDTKEENDIEAIKAQLLEQLRKEETERIKAELQAEMKENIAETKTIRPQIDRYRHVPVMNVTNGTLVYVSRNGAEWVWEGYGAVEDIEYHELQTMKSSQRRFIDEPFIIILDEEVVSAMGLERQYEKLDREQLQSLDVIFKLRQEEFEKTLKSLPKGIQHSVITRANYLYGIGKLESLAKIRFINEEFGTDIGFRG